MEDLVLNENKFITEKKKKSNLEFAEAKPQKRRIETNIKKKKEEEKEEEDEKKEEKKKKNQLKMKKKKKKNQLIIMVSNM